MRTQRLMDRLYPTKAKAPRIRRPGFWTRLSFSWAGPYRWPLAIVATVLLFLWAGVHLHYYNKLISMETSVQAAWAQVETAMQRRHNVQRNLTRISRRYAQHEQLVLTQLTELRSRMALERLASERTQRSASPIVSPLLPGTEPGAIEGSPPSTTVGTKTATLPGGLDQVTSPIALTAEQYPQLMLSKNMQQFSAALVEVETEVARATMAYNDAVNIFSTELGQFPGNVFGWLCGFKDATFYQPERDTLGFREVEY